MPGNCLFFNCPVRQLSDRAIDVRNIQGFSQDNKICGAFLDRTQQWNQEAKNLRFNHNDFSEDRKKKILTLKDIV